MIYYRPIYDILLTNIWYITEQYMIYYFTIYDILHHESIAQEALEHAFASIGAWWWKLWSTMLQAIEHDVANEGIWFCGCECHCFCPRDVIVWRPHPPVTPSTPPRTALAAVLAIARESIVFLGWPCFFPRGIGLPTCFVSISQRAGTWQQKWKILSKDVKNLSICLVVSNYCFNFAAVNVPKTRNWNSKLKNFRIWLQWMLHVGAGVAQDLKSRESSDRMESCITIKGSAVLNDRPLFL